MTDTDYRIFAILRRAEADISEIMQKSVRVKIIVEGAKQIQIDQIAEIVAKDTGITITEMKSKSHKQEIVIARDLVVGLSLQHISKITETYIGTWMGKRDPSTINFAKDRHQERMECYDKSYKNQFNRLSENINERHEELQCN